MEISEMTYASQGVSLNEQNRVNAAVAEKLKKKGMKAEGLFGGAVDISGFKSQEKVYVDIKGSSIIEGDNHVDTGARTTKSAFLFAEGEVVASLDYIALTTMGDIVPDFVEGVAMTSASYGVPVIGGESAELPNTYQEGKIDSFVHLLSIRDDEGADITDLIRDMERPLLVGSTDGTGTKTKITRNPTDIISHGFNDVSAQGVKPIGFAMYVAGNVDEKELKEIDIKAGKLAKELGVTKLDTIIQQRPETYLPGEVDIAATVIGVVDEKDLITGSDVGTGDKIIGIGVDGYMTNGCSFVRGFVDALLEKGVVSQIDQPMDDLEGRTLLYEMSRPHRPMTDILFGYDNVQGILEKYKGKIKGMAHITGGGLIDNIVRMVPDSCKAVVKGEVLPVPPLMELMLKHGANEEELYNTFNMGVGFTLTVAEDFADEIVKYINDNFRYRIEDVDRKAAIIGDIQAREKKYQWAN